MATAIWTWAHSVTANASGFDALDFSETTATTRAEAVHAPRPGCWPVGGKEMEMAALDAEREQNLDPRHWRERW